VTYSPLPQRALLFLSGEELHHFLDRLITCAVPSTGEATFGALLAPQGKIQFDFFLAADADGIWLDCATETAPELLKRLTFYRLRAAVKLEDRSADFGLAAGEGPAPEGAVLAFTDPRDAALGMRAILPVEALAGLEAGGESAPLTRRVTRGMPEGGVDFIWGDIFPHDAGFDQYGGVDFSKGCFVGQEVVSRMQHRGTARKRPVIVESLGGADLPAGAPLVTGGRTLAPVTSIAGARGLAIARLDRIADAKAAGADITVGGVPVALSLPPWADYGWPEENSGKEGAQ